MALPSGYTQLTSIQSSGAQYIDTLFKPNNNTRVVMDVKIQTPSAATLGVFGVRDSSGSTAANMFAVWTTGTGTKMRSDYFGTNKTGNNSIINARVQIDKNKNVYTDTAGNSLTNTAATGQCANNMHLFAINNVGKANYFGAMQLYSCQVYDNGTLIRDFVPCVDPNDKAGLYDTVNGKFYGNAGSGDFARGEIVVVPGTVAAGYTLINGTSYKITGGKSLVGGTGYSIKKGRTLVGGTAYDVSFETPVDVIISGESMGSSGTQRIIIDNKAYRGPATIQTTTGSEIKFVTFGSAYGNLGSNAFGEVIINGTVAFKNNVTSGSGYQTFSWIVPDGVHTIRIVIATQYDVVGNYRYTVTYS